MSITPERLARLETVQFQAKLIAASAANLFRIHGIETSAAAIMELVGKDDPSISDVEKIGPVFNVRLMKHAAPANEIPPVPCLVKIGDRWVLLIGCGPDGICSLFDSVEGAVEITRAALFQRWGGVIVCLRKNP